MAKKKSKPMSRALRAFLKKHGRFPKKGELKRARSRGKSKRKSDVRKRGSVRGKKDYVFTAARRRTAIRNLRRGRRRKGRGKKRRRQSRRSHRIRRPKRRGGRRSGGVSIG